MKAKTTSAREYEFTLVLADISELTPEVESALFEAGCDDATLSIRMGRPYLTFSRTAESLKDAIFSAIRSVRNANVGMNVLRVDDCNLVTQSEIAHRINVSRQLVNMYVDGTRGPGGFPPPACDITEGAPLWSWCEVSYWLWQNGMIQEEVLRDAREISIINNVLEMMHQRATDPALTDEVCREICGEDESCCP